VFNTHDACIYTHEQYNFLADENLEDQVGSEAF